MKNEQRHPARNAAATAFAGSHGSASVGLDELLEVRERLVVILDAIDQDNIDGARFYFDREVQR